MLGGTATRADATGQAIEVIEDEIQLMAKEGPTEEELTKAKTYLKGSFALGLDTSTKIASQLVQMQLDNLGIDYIERRSALIDAVTLADTKRVAKRLLDPGLLFTRRRPSRRASPRKTPRGWFRRLAGDKSSSPAFREAKMPLHAIHRSCARRNASAPQVSPRRPSPTRSRRTGEALAWLRARHADGSLPLLRLPAATDDLAAIRARPPAV